MMLAIATLRNLEVYQMDEKKIFLNDELVEKNYMEQSKGFIVFGQEKKLYKTVKSLYFLKQEPKQQHEKFDHAMITNGFKVNESGKCVYINDMKMVMSFVFIRG